MDIYLATWKSRRVTVFSLSGRPVGQERQRTMATDFSVSGRPVVQQSHSLLPISTVTFVSAPLFLSAARCGKNRYWYATGAYKGCLPVRVTLLGQSQRTSSVTCGESHVSSYSNYRYFYRFSSWMELQRTKLVDAEGPPLRWAYLFALHGKESSFAHWMLLYNWRLSNGDLWPSRTSTSVLDHLGPSESNVGMHQDLPVILLPSCQHRSSIEKGQYCTGVGMYGIH